MEDTVAPPQQQTKEHIRAVLNLLKEALEHQTVNIRLKFKENGTSKTGVFELMEVEDTSIEVARGDEAQTIHIEDIEEIVC